MLNDIGGEMTNKEKRTKEDTKCPSISMSHLINCRECRNKYCVDRDRNDVLFWESAKNSTMEK